MITSQCYVYISDFRAGFKVNSWNLAHKIILLHNRKYIYISLDFQRIMSSCEFEEIIVVNGFEIFGVESRCFFEYC
jgi:hypothetical protein